MEPEQNRLSRVSGKVPSALSYYAAGQGEIENPLPILPCLKSRKQAEEIETIISTIVGMESLKLQLRKWAKGLILCERRNSLGLTVGSKKPLHMAFLGNPGTGKTMVARIMGKIFNKLGLLPTDKVTEVQRTDLVGEYTGQTGKLTRKKIEEAKGGILFVDEVYRLVPYVDKDKSKDFGIEALEEILSSMDEGDVVFIFAGYREPMKRVISANMGFTRRVSKLFHFEDYNIKDIAQILHSKIMDQVEGNFLYGYRLHSECTVEAVATLIAEESTVEQRQKFNGGLVHPWLVNALESLDYRLDVDCHDVNKLVTITMEDLKEGLQALRSQHDSPENMSQVLQRMRRQVERRKGKHIEDTEAGRKQITGSNKAISKMAKTLTGSRGVKLKKAQVSLRRQSQIKG